MDAPNQQTTCCIVGGGPAGIMLGYLLARGGVDVTVLEKHPDFFRDFRGDTVHPSTMEVLNELGLLDEFLKVPHQEVRTAGVIIGGTHLPVADFRHVPSACKFVALMPQWDFLNFLSSQAKKFPAFHLLMEHEATGLLEKNGRVTGVVAQNQGNEVRIGADLVVGCDGRHSITRPAAHLELTDFGVPIDVLWFRISRRPDDPAEVLGNVNYGRMLILINRGEYFQCGLMIAKGSYDEIQSRGLDEFRASIRRIAPYLRDRVNEITGWDQVKILTVQINRLPRWHRPGLLCIGDAAHAMSPAGGVGINLAIQDAVATANLLVRPLRERRVTQRDLEAVQRRRDFPAKVTQAVQRRAHNGMARIFRNPGPIEAPWQAKAITRIPGIHRALGYGIGMGVRPEHVRDTGQARQAESRKSARVVAGLGIASVAVLGFALWKSR